MEGLKQLTQAELSRIFKKNALLDVLGNEGQQIVVVGDTSTGKSTVINFLLGFPINFEASGIGTRRPCVLTQVQKMGQKTVQFSARFCKGGESLFVEETDDVSRIATLVAKANDHHNMHYFSCLEGHTDVQAAYEKAFDGEPVYVKMYHEDFKYGLRLVDLPGLTRRNPEPMSIAKTYIQPGNVAILVIGKDNASNGGFPELAEAMCACEQVLVIQNFAHNLLKTARNVQDNYDCIKKTFQGKQSKHAEGLNVYCVDFGKPNIPEFQSMWKKSTDKMVEDQENWQQMASSGGLEVQSKMYKHAKGWGERLKKECEKDANKDGRQFDWGILPVLNKVVDFQLFEIDRQIGELKDRVHARIGEKQNHVVELQEQIEKLQDPAEWQDLLAKLAKVVSEYLDTTIAIPDEKDACGGSVDFTKALMTIDEEIEQTSKFMATYKKDPDEKVDFQDRSVFLWFNEELDSKIRKIVERPLEAKGSLCNLKSWQRLLDELTAMLAFAPMPFVSKSKKLQAYQRVGVGSGAEMNKLDIMVELVSEAKLCNKQPIYSLLQTFKYRFLYLAHRDLRNCVEIFKQDLTHELRDFLKVLGEDVQHPDKPCAKRDEICEQLLSGLLDNMTQSVQNCIDGIYEMDPTIKGKRKYDKVCGRAVKKAESGLCVRVYENRPINQGPCHWLLPFKAHYVNGQIPWKDLKLSAKCRESHDDEHDMENKWIDELAEDQTATEVSLQGQSMNAASAVNMYIFQLSTDPYDVVLGFDSKEDDGRDFDVDLEVMKMLKAMQAEIAAFWASAWKGMIQHIKDEASVSDELERKIQKKLSKSGLHHNFNMSDLVSGLKTAVHSVNSVISGTDFPENIGKSTDEETSDLATMSKDPVLRNAAQYPWPGLDKSTYRDLLEKLKDDDTLGEGFPSTKDKKIAGEYAWIRLCQEFIFVILQLAMRRATCNEISMAKASCGKTTLAGGFEIVTKLVLHRLRALGQDSGTFFRNRLMNLYNRDLKFAMGHIQDFNISAVGEIKGTDFVEDFLRHRTEKIVNWTLAMLQCKFNELMPFDFSILNGRLPLLKATMRSVDYELQDDHGQAKAEKRPESEATGRIEKNWSASLLAQWPTELVGKLTVEPEDNPKLARGEVSGLVLAHDTNKEAFACLTDTEAVSLVTKYGSLKDDDPPAAGMAGGAFHSMLLRIHKAMHVNAIDYCRPKFKNMMTRVYQEDHVRMQLQRNKFMAKTSFEKVCTKKTHDMHEVEAKIKQMQETLDMIDRPEDHHEDDKKGAAATRGAPAGAPAREARTRRRG